MLRSNGAPRWQPYWTGFTAGETRRASLTTSHFAQQASSGLQDANAFASSSLAMKKKKKMMMMMMMIIIFFIRLCLPLPLPLDHHPSAQRSGDSTRSS
jgi:hypothetical protein